MASSGYLGYRYLNLPNPSSIRLLKPCPARDFKDVKFSMVLADLKGNVPCYYALSYTWGEARDSDEISHSLKKGIQEEPKKSCSVTIDDIEIEVQPNLYDALEQFNSLGWKVLLWIDAICINQQDLEEKNIQICNMGRIYNKATTVLIWLGKDVNNDGRIISESIHRLSELVSDPYTAQLIANKTEAVALADVTNPETLRPFGLQDWSIDRWLGLGFFLSRRWFRRLWCFQEVILAADPSVIFAHYGEVTVDWVVFWGASKVLEATGMGKSMSTLVANTMGRLRLKNTSIGKELSSIAIAGYLGKRDFNPQWGLVKALTGRPISQLSTAGLLALILWFTRTWETTDPRDKVFAILGVHEEITRARGLQSLEIKPSYHKTAAVVFTETTAQIIRETESLGILGLLSDPSKNTIPDLPSWVLDLTSRGAASLLFHGTAFDNGRQYNASKGEHPAWLPLATEDNILHVQGIHLGKVLHLSEILTNVNEFGQVEVLMDIFFKMPKIYSTGQHCSEVLWRTLIGDCDGSEQGQSPAQDDVGIQFKAWLLFIFARRRNLERWWNNDDSGHYEILLKIVDDIARTASGSNFPSRSEIETLVEDCQLPRKTIEEGMEILIRATQGQSDAFDTAAFWTTPHRRLFITAEKQLCLGPESTKPDDLVYIVAGAQTPFVIRPVHTRDGTEDTFHLIGEVYVHGYMHGEALHGNPSFRPLHII